MAAPAVRSPALSWQRCYQVQFAPSLRGLGHLRPQLPGLVGRLRFALVVLIGAVGGD
ncbi:hypothetical protein [Streptomyces hirsutus]|uniref:hypothetical protein n=1 Tax=Streptomyces hirsutus TaxID=35620 RepID=UPI00332BFDB7